MCLVHHDNFKAHLGFTLIILPTLLARVPVTREIAATLAEDASA